jgi:hypothetical protein
MLVRVLIIAASLALGLVILMWSVYQAAQAQPDFHRRAMDMTAQEAATLGGQTEQEVLQLTNAVQFEQAWQFRLSEQQINGWLADQLPRKHADVIPPGISDVRVEIADGRLRLAFRVARGWARGYIVARLRIFLTDQPNQIAIVVEQVKWGWIPLPIGALGDSIAGQLRRAGVNVLWTQLDGSPTALVRLPPTLGQSDERWRFQVESVEMHDDALDMRGHVIFDAEPRD